MSRLDFCACLLMTVLTFMVAALDGRSEDMVIDSFDKDGRISWTCPTNKVTSYRVEWASHPAGQWNNGICTKWIQCLTIALSPESTGSWDLAEELILKISKNMDIGFKMS